MKNFSLCMLALFYLTLNFALMSVVADYFAYLSQLRAAFSDVTDTASKFATRHINKMAV
ncbi:hypothetical protein [Campylobacter sp.]|jgi:hypothetical protein|uniref:hypothetical protein n=1 Tax=Campylobacter sp. TaxID=205 RepID=UPI003615B230